MIKENNTPAQALTMVMMPREEFDGIVAKLDRLEQLISDRNSQDRASEWIESEEARKILNISPKTWQTYRDEGRIPFAQHGRKIYVLRKDLDDFLNSCRITRRR